MDQILIEIARNEDSATELPNRLELFEKSTTFPAGPVIATCSKHTSMSADKAQSVARNRLDVGDYSHWVGSNGKRNLLDSDGKTLAARVSFGFIRYG